MSCSICVDPRHETTLKKPPLKEAFSLRIPLKGRFEELNTSVTLCKAPWFGSVGSGSADESLSKHRFLWRHCAYCNHGDEILREFGECLSEVELVTAVHPAVGLHTPLHCR